MSKRTPPNLSRPICPCTLGPSKPDMFSRKGLKTMFAGKRVSPHLSLHQPREEGLTEQAYLEQLGRLSLSGVQEKYALVQQGTQLRLTLPGERGSHILKPMVNDRRLKLPELMPANEHLSMQVASQVFGIATAANSIVALADGELAYLTRRFDYRNDGQKYRVEDFAGLAGYTPQTQGQDFKYKGSYLDCFMLLQQYVPAYRIEAERFLKLLLVNYLICNGDAHLKNFSLIETELGDHKLAPAYDLLNTDMHIKSDPFALQHGLLPPEQAGGKVKDAFTRLATLAELPTSIVETFVDSLPALEPTILRLVEASFLPEAAKRQWLQLYQGRRAKLLRG